MSTDPRSGPEGPRPAGPGARQLSQIDLRHERGPGGVRSLTARRGPDGGVVIEGQDIGRDVEEVFGDGLREYEWDWTIAPDAVPAAVAALGGEADDDLLALLKAWSVDHGGRDPGIFLQEAGVPVEFWSRIGD